MWQDNRSNFRIYRNSLVILFHFHVHIYTEFEWKRQAVSSTAHFTRSDCPKIPFFLHFVHLLSSRKIAVLHKNQQYRKSKKISIVQRRFGKDWSLQKQCWIHGIRCVLVRTGDSFGKKRHFCMVWVSAGWTNGRTDGLMDGRTDENASTNSKYHLAALQQPLHLDFPSSCWSSNSPTYIFSKVPIRYFLMFPISNVFFSLS